MNQFDESVLKKMLSFDDTKGRTIDELKSLIIRGHEIKAEDEKVLETQGVMRSHYHLSAEDKEAMAAASRYDIMIEPEEDGAFIFDEEE